MTLVRHSRVLVCVPFVAAFACVLGCSSNSGPRFPDASSYCNGRAQAECSDQVLLACGIASKATCVAHRQTVCASSIPGGTTYNSSAASGCVDEVGNAYADAQLSQAESDAIGAACESVFDGPGIKGGTCQLDTDCMTSMGLRCVLAPGSAKGTCQVPQPVQGGESCSAPDAQCVAGFHCGTTAHCDAEGAANDPCDSTDPCGVGLNCSSQGTCVSKAADGTSCMTDEECLNGICNKASTAATGVCVSQVSLAPNEPFCLDSQ